MSKVYITGIGITSCLGQGVAQNYQRLLDGETGIKQETFNDQERYMGRFEKSNQELQSELGFAPDDVISRTALIGLQAAKEAWANQSDNGLKAAFLNGSTVGGMDLSENYFTSENKEENVHLFAMHDLGSITNFIANNLFPFDYKNTISTACSSAANAIMLGSQMIETGEFDRVLVGGTDALCEFTMQGFKSLMVYSDNWCMPFDENRSGLNLGEGAAYVVLESEKSIALSKNEILGEAIGWANANDAYHSTGTSPEGFGAQKSMQEALQKARLNIDDIDYINAHGTATNNNDSSELAAMQKLFKNEIPPYSSTKAFTGHTLAAAGALEAVFSILALQNSVVFKNLNNHNPIDNSGSLISATEDKNINTVLSNSFGFGGNCTSLIFKCKS